MSLIETENPLTRQITETFEQKKNVWETAEVLRLDPMIVRYHLRKSGIVMPPGSYRRLPTNKSPGACLSQRHASIGAKIAYLRMEKGMNDPAELAGGIGMSTKKYCAIERGQCDATISDLTRIANGFKLSLSELLEPLKI